MQEIEALALSVCRSLAQGQPPVIQFERRSYWLGSADSTRASTAEDEENAEGEAAATADAQQQHRLCWGYARSARSFAITLRLLAQIFSNLTSDVVSTKRELYYSDVNLFKCQQAADAGIENIVMLLKTPRHSLHVVANPKGVFVGNVAMAYEGAKLSREKANGSTATAARSAGQYRRSGTASGPSKWPPATFLCSKSTLPSSALHHRTFGAYTDPASSSAVKAILTWRHASSCTG
eukprot:TRINITY_DN4692_c0_g1_i3.p2 TRINITY_DN4692_c0_g1~~TRINITY_DN4692_c0_g1_i3.p2  ORF type:complete len:236 (+),score=42.05 TRINITY_DN4692_c0_g1_i3:355-1062(+)